MFSILWTQNTQKYHVDISLSCQVNGDFSWKPGLLIWLPRVCFVIQLISCVQSRYYRRLYYQPQLRVLRKINPVYHWWNFFLHILETCWLPFKTSAQKGQLNSSSYCSPLSTIFSPSLSSCHPPLSCNDFPFPNVLLFPFLSYITSTLSLPSDILLFSSSPPSPLLPTHLPVGKIQTKCISTILIHYFHGIGVILLALAHLLPILSQHQPISYEVLERWLAKQCCGKYQQCVKPTSCLVNTLSYEVSREAVFKLPPPLKWVVHLGKGEERRVKWCILALLGIIILISVKWSNQHWKSTWQQLRTLWQGGGEITVITMSPVGLSFWRALITR